MASTNTGKGKTNSQVNPANVFVNLEKKTDNILADFGVELETFLVPKPDTLKLNIIDLVNRPNSLDLTKGCFEYAGIGDVDAFDADGEDDAGKITGRITLNRLCDSINSINRIQKSKNDVTDECKEKLKEQKKLAKKVYKSYVSDYADFKGKATRYSIAHFLDSQYLAKTPQHLEPTLEPAIEPTNPVSFSAVEGYKEPPCNMKQGLWKVEQDTSVVWDIKETDGQYQHVYNNISSVNPNVFMPLLCPPALMGHIIDQVEFVAPKLKDTEVDQVVEVGDYIKTHFDMYNNSKTSQHVHISLRKKTEIVPGEMQVDQPEPEPEPLKMFQYEPVKPGKEPTSMKPFDVIENIKKCCMAWLWFEPFFFLMVPHWRRKNKYAQAMRELVRKNFKSTSAYIHFFDNPKTYLNKIAKASLTLKAEARTKNYEENLGKLLTFFQGDPTEASNRYAALNLMNLCLDGIGTIEVRIRHGSDDFKDFSDYIEFFIEFFKVAVSNPMICDWEEFKIGGSNSRSNRMFYQLELMTPDEVRESGLVALQTYFTGVKPPDTGIAFSVNEHVQCAEKWVLNMKYYQKCNLLEDPYQISMKPSVATYVSQNLEVTKVTTDPTQASTSTAKQIAATANVNIPYLKIIPISASEEAPAVAFYSDPTKPQEDADLSDDEKSSSDEEEEQSGGAISNEPKYPVFSYGSNSAVQLSERVGARCLDPVPAYIKNHSRIFAGHSKRWDDGAIASIHPLKEQNVYGALVELTEAQLLILDSWEGGYTRVRKQAYLLPFGTGKSKTSEAPSKHRRVNAFVYVKDDTTFHTMPSEKYMAAIRKNLTEVGFDKKLAIVMRAVDSKGRVVVKGTYKNKVQVKVKNNGP